MEPFFSESAAVAMSSKRKREFSTPTGQKPVRPHKMRRKAKIGSFERGVAATADDGASNVLARRFLSLPSRGRPKTWNDKNDLNLITSIANRTPQSWPNTSRRVQVWEAIAEDCRPDTNRFYSSFTMSAPAKRYLVLANACLQRVARHYVPFNTHTQAKEVSLSMARGICQKFGIVSLG